MERTVVCLSPVHVGTGQTVDPFDYVAEGNRYRRIDHDAFMERLTEVQVQALTQWASTQADALAAAPDRGYARDRGPGNQELARQRTQFHLLSFAQSHARDLVLPLREDPLLARYEGIGQPDRNLQVREQIKDAGTVPVVPGSSLKGAVRTALAYQALLELTPAERQQCASRLAEAVARGQTERRNRGRVPRRLQESIGHELEDPLFRFGRKAGDIHADLMRFVSISDTLEPVAGPVRLMVPQLHTFAPGRDASRRGPGPGQALRGAHAGVVPGRTERDLVVPGLQPQAPLIVEAHAPGNAFRIRVRVDTDLLQTIHGSSRRGDFPGWERCVRRIFGAPALALLQERRPGAELQAAIWQRIASACRAFGRAILAEDLAWAQAHDAPEMVRFCERLAGLPPESVLLRLGWGSHFMSTTLFLALRAQPEWQPLLAGCFALFDTGRPPGRRAVGGEPRPVSVAGFPRSRRLISVRRRAVAPLGWLLVAEPGASLPPPLVTSEELLAAAVSDPKPPERRPVSGGGRFPPGGTRGGAGGRSGAGGAGAGGSAVRPEPPLPRPTRPPATSPIPGGVRRGDKVKATVIAVAGRRVTVRLDSGEELSYELPVALLREGASVKVKIDAVDGQGRITRVIPG